MTRPAPRPDLQSLQPYHSSETAGGRILLHANENPYPLPPEIMDEVLEAIAKLDLNRYPDPHNRDLIGEIASYAGVDPSWVTVGDGSNEVLLQACLAYGGPQRTALLFEPTYVMHQRQARMAGTNVAVVSRRDDFSLDVDAALGELAQRSPAVVFVCTPNNPTGTVTPLDDIRKIAGATSALVVVDEAYFEFSGVSIVPFIDRHANVLAVRTLSKAFRLAGVRVGYGIGNPRLLSELGRVRMPYAQSSFTQATAPIVLRHREKVLDVVARIVAERERLSSALAALDSIDVFPSGANFVFFRHPAADALMAGLAERGIVIRDFSTLGGCEDCLRVTAGRPDENDEFLDATAALS